MSRLKNFGLILIAVAMLISCTTAADISKTGMTESKDGYTVTFVDSEKADDSQTRTIYQTITEGETDWISTQISGYYTQFNVNLNWGDSSDSLRLMIYSPDGHTFGYYYDNSDGTINGRITLNINNPDGIAEGTWWYQVYGYSVSGEEDYYI